MATRPYTGPTGLTFTDSAIHIEGYPDAERVGLLQTKLAKRLADLRTHQSALTFCEQVVQELPKILEQSPTIARASAIGLVATYFSCFGDNQASAPLSYKRVFKGLADAQTAFRYWKAVRDKHMIHNESAYDHSSTLVALGPNAEVQDIISIKLTPNLLLDSSHIESFSQLIPHTLKFVGAEIDNLLPRAFEEVRGMTIAERNALPTATYTAPTIEKAFETRSG